MAVEHLDRQGFVTFLPLIRAAKRRRGRWQSPLEALFPGYLFTQLDLQTQNTAPIRSTRGVIGLVRFGGEIRPVPDALVSELQARRAGEAIEFDALFKKDDAVTLVDGPFIGLTGIFQAQTGPERVAILLDLMGRSNKVTVSPHQIVPAL